MKKLLVIALTTLSLTSCSQSGVTAGIIVTSWKDTISGSVNNAIEPRREGRACIFNVLGLFAFGDSSVSAAKRDGGINRIAVVDTTYFSILGLLYQKGCTIVKGE